MRIMRVLWSGALKDETNFIRVHPCQRPIKLYTKTLELYAQPGDKILDTHMGSQSSRIATYRAGLDYYGWELDPEYFAAGCKRFKEQTMQISLFEH